MIIHSYENNPTHCTGCHVLFTGSCSPMSQTQIIDIQGDLDYIELFCDDCAEAGMGEECDKFPRGLTLDGPCDDEIDEYDEYDHDDQYDWDSSMASAGFGMDEDYGCFGDNF